MVQPSPQNSRPSDLAGQLLLARLRPMPGVKRQRGVSDIAWPTRRAPSSPQEVLLAPFDSPVLPAAVLDGHGVVLRTNAVWKLDRSFLGGREEAIDEGINYVQACQRAQGVGAQEARQAALGIQEVMAGGRSAFSLEYPLALPGETRWYAVRAKRFYESGRVRVLVSHERLS